MTEQQLAKVSEVPLTSLLQSRLVDINQICPNVGIDRDGAIDLCEAVLADVDVKQVKVYKGREQRGTIREYLEEIPTEAIVRVAEVVAQASQGVRWTNILGGRAFTFFQWMTLRYPILSLLREVCERQRGEARASKALDTLDGIAEEAEQDGARVKACELTLRAHHSAFGSKTLEKVGNTRPIIVVNIDKIFGGRPEQTEVIDAEVVTK